MPEAVKHEDSDEPSFAPASSSSFVVRSSAARLVRLVIAVRKGPLTLAPW